MVIAEIFGLEIPSALGPPLVAGGVGLLLVGLRAFALVISGAQERRRELYSEAYKAAMAWGEMVYRVRRRAHDDQSERALIERFHALQEQIDYYEGWTATESKAMGRSYCRLVRAIKSKTEAEIRAAWDESVSRRPGEPAREGEDHPDLSVERDAFLADVRNHVSLLLLFRPLVWWRNRTRRATS